MPGGLSSQGLAAVFAQETDAEFVVLLTFTNSSLPAPIRVCSGGREINSRGELFQFFPFELERPSSHADAPPSARLTIDNVDRRIVEAVRQITGELEVAIEIVLRSQPSVLEEGPIHLILRNVEYDAGVVRGDLQPEPILSEPCPPDQFTPSRNPALFRGSNGGQ